MKGAIISFSQKGYVLSARAAAVLAEKGYEVERAVKCHAVEAECSVKEPLTEWVKRNFAVQDVLVFIGSVSIAVRAIAPYVHSKAEDPAVLVIDELGRHCIPILSGHLGGANELAVFLAGRIMAEPVITTATDLNHKWAVDLFAAKNQLHIKDLKKIKEISAKLLDGQEIVLAMEGCCKAAGNKGVGNRAVGKVPEGVRLCGLEGLEEAPDVIVGVRRQEQWEDALYLVPRAVVLGIGCRKGTNVLRIREAVDRLIRREGILKAAVTAVASIDLKADEEGILTYCREENLTYRVYSAEELRQVEGEFSSSEFVLQAAGVDNVCERSAVLASKGRLIAEKRAFDGVTAAAAVMDWRVLFE